MAVLDLDSTSWNHVVHALALHAAWARANGIAVPPDVLKLASVAAKSARRRHATTEVAAGVAVADGVGVGPQLITYDGAADALSVSKRTIERLVNRGALLAVKVAGAARIRRRDLDEFIAAGRERHTTDPQEAA